MTIAAAPLLGQVVACCQILQRTMCSSAQCRRLPPKPVKAAKRRASHRGQGHEFERTQALELPVQARNTKSIDTTHLAFAWLTAPRGIRVSTANRWCAHASDFCASFALSQ